MINLCTKFKVPACSRYEHMNGGAKCKNLKSLALAVAEILHGV